MENVQKINKRRGIDYVNGFEPSQELKVQVSREIRTPEPIEKFYKQIITSFGYAYSAKL